MSEEKLYRVFRCYSDCDMKFDIGYYLSSDDPKTILIKSVIGMEIKSLYDSKDELLKFVIEYMEKHSDKTEFKTEKELLDAIEKRGIPFLYRLYCDNFDKEINIIDGNWVECQYVIEDPDALPGSRGSIYSGGSYFGIVELGEFDTKTLNLISGDIKQYLKITDDTIEKK